MADLPIPFSAPMVRALLREIEAPGTGKTQTRREIKVEPFRLRKGTHPDIVTGATYFSVLRGGEHTAFPAREIRYRVGDRLYVREHWRTFVSLDATAPRDLWSPGCGRGAGILYVADEGGMSLDARGACHIGKRDNPAAFGRHRQGMHMPRWASRLTLIVTEVRVERLRDCSEADAIAEGIERAPQQPSTFRHYGVLDGFAWLGDPVHSYSTLWDHINGPGAWAKNPWVAAYSFRPILGNIDRIGGEA